MKTLFKNETVLEISGTARYHEVVYFSFKKFSINIFANKINGVWTYNANLNIWGDNKWNEIVDSNDVNIYYSSDKKVKDNFELIALRFKDYIEAVFND